MTLSNKARASGEASADSGSGKSRVPASMTGWPGRNLRVAGLGVCSVRISMGAMWPSGPFQSRTKGRSAGDDPSGDSHPDGEADQRNPPFAWTHRFRAWIDHAAAGDHRLGQMPATNPVEDDCGHMEGDQ